MSSANSRAIRTIRFHGCNRGSFLPLPAWAQTNTQRSQAQRANTAAACSTVVVDPALQPYNFFDLGA